MHLITLIFDTGVLTIDIRLSNLSNHIHMRLSGSQCNNEIMRILARGWREESSIYVEVFIQVRQISDICFMPYRTALTVLNRDIMIVS